MGGGVWMQPKRRRVKQRQSGHRLGNGDLGVLHILCVLSIRLHQALPPWGVLHPAWQTKSEARACVGTPTWGRNAQPPTGLLRRGSGPTSSPSGRTGEVSLPRHFWRAKPGEKIEAMCMQAALQRLTKNVLVFYFMHITNRCFIRQNFSFKNRFLLFEIF